MDPGPSFSLGITGLREAMKVETINEANSLPSSMPTIEVSLPSLSSGSGVMKLNPISLSIIGDGASSSRLVSEVDREASQVLGLEVADLNDVSQEFQDALLEPLVPAAVNAAVVPFLNEDVDFQVALADGGNNPSRRVDQWAFNRINEFRNFKGLDTTIPFDELPHA